VLKRLREQNKKRKKQLQREETRRFWLLLTGVITLLIAADITLYFTYIPNKDDAFMRPYLPNNKGC